MIFSKLKIYAIAVVGALLTAMAAALKIRTAQYKKAKKEATDAQERVDHGH
jgi:hypothetical protein